MIYTKFSWLIQPLNTKILRKREHSQAHSLNWKKNLPSWRLFCRWGNVFFLFYRNSFRENASKSRVSSRRFTRVDLVVFAIHFQLSEGKGFPSAHCKHSPPFLASSAIGQISVRCTISLPDLNFPLTRSGEFVSVDTWPDGRSRDRRCMSLLAWSYLPFIRKSLFTRVVSRSSSSSRQRLYCVPLDTAIIHAVISEWIKGFCKNLR